MTYPEFENFRVDILTASGNMTWLMTQKIANDVRTSDNIPAYKKDLYVIYVLNRYIDILLEYNPVALNATDTNFFNVLDMLEIQRKINGILNTSYNLDFILTS